MGWSVTSPLRLDPPGPAGAAVVTLLLLIAAAPALLLMGDSGGGVREVVEDPAFRRALGASGVVAWWTAVISFVLGWPAGVLASLASRPGRHGWIALLLLPAVVPSTLWALGWSMLAGQMGADATRLLETPMGCSLAHASFGVPVVTMAAYVAVRGLGATQLEVCLLGGGPGAVVRSTLRHASGPALLASGIGGVLASSDAGPSTVLGLRSAPSEILTSFSAFYDFPAAGAQCAMLCGAALLAAAPLVAACAPRLAVPSRPREVRSFEVLSVRVASGRARVGLSLLVALLTLPLLGLALPLRAGVDLRTIEASVSESLPNTMLYGAGAGLVAALWGFGFAIAVGGTRRRAIVAAGLALALLALPAAAGALGWSRLAASAPPHLDPWLRGRAAVAVVLGLHFAPVAGLLCLRARQAIPISWAEASALAGVSATTHAGRVVLPVMRPALVASFAVAALLACADVPITLLLHPPGERSLAVGVFTVMANAPEALVAGLSVAYVVSVLLVALVCGALVRRLP